LRIRSSQLSSRLACLFVLAAVGGSITASAGAKELRWGRERSVATNSWSPAGSRHLAPAQDVPPRVDPAVRPAAFEENDGPQLVPGAEGRARVRSIVINRIEATDGLRSAQLPSSGSGTDASGQTGTTGSDTELEEELRSPFIDTPELPQLEPTPPEGFDVQTPTQPEVQPEVQPETPQLEAPQPEPIEPPTIESQPNIPIVETPADQAPDAVPSVSSETLEAEQKKSADACTKGFEDLRKKTVNTLDLSIVVSGEEGSDYPYECSLEDAWHPGRCWEQTTYMWKASALCHKPLFFEDEQLERYGHSFTPCFQPFVSGAHFFTRLPILPYCMGVEPPHECIYALGHYRPGNCAPYMCNPVPLSPRGALFQAGAVVGAAAILP
jgi:hypothetical protein